MRIAVTGALGSLGRWVSRSVREAGHTLRSIDVRDGSDGSLSVDLRDFDATVEALHGADAVVHLAAHPNPIEDRAVVVYNENTTISFNVLSAAVQVGITRLVVASSINAVGGEFSEVRRYDKFPVQVSTPTQARDEYSFSKWVLERQVEYFGRLCGTRLSIVCLRLHAVQPREVQCRAYLQSPDRGRRNLWGYSPPRASADALVRALEVCPPGVHFGYLVSTRHAMDCDVRELIAEHYPGTPCDASIVGDAGLFDTSFAQTVLGWSS